MFAYNPNETISVMIHAVGIQGSGKTKLHNAIRDFLLANKDFDMDNVTWAREDGDKVETVHFQIRLAHPEA